MRNSFEHRTQSTEANIGRNLGPCRASTSETWERRRLDVLQTKRQLKEEPRTSAAGNRGKAGGREEHRKQLEYKWTEHAQESIRATKHSQTLSRHQDRTRYWT